MNATTRAPAAKNIRETNEGPVMAVRGSEGVKSVEIGSRDLDPNGLEESEEAWTHPCRLERAEDPAVLIGTLPHETENLLHLDDVAFHARHFSEAHQAPRAVR